MKERKYKGPDRVNHSINSFIIIITVATVFSPFIVIKKKILCTVHLKIFRGNNEN